MKLGSVDHAEDRTGLKTLWTLKPALVVHDDGSVWQTHRIIKPKGEPFTVHMAVKPGVNPKDDMKVDSMQLWAGAPRPAGVKCVVTGAIGGEFRDASGDTAARLLSLKVGAGGNVTVRYLKYKVGGAEPAMSQAKDMGWAAFWAKYEGKVQEPPPSEDDSYLGSGDDSEDEGVEHTAEEADEPPPPKKQKTASTCPTQLLQSLAPKLELVAVAKVLFGDTVLCEAAGVEQYPAQPEDGVSEARYTMRYARALQRLVGVVGKAWWPSKPVSTVEALGMVCEDIRDLIARAKRLARHPGTGSAQAARPQSAAYVHGGIGDASGKAAAPLSRESAERAVPSSVAVRLHDQVGLLHDAWARSGCDVGVAVALVGDSVRSDLQRVLSSNGKVDAAGEYTLAKRNLPSIVHVMKRALAESVAADILSVAVEDVSGQQYMDRASAIALADRVVVGHVQLADFVQASRDLLGVAAPQKGSLRELQDGFALAHRALGAVLQRVFLCTGQDSGMQLLDRRIRVTAASSVANIDGQAASDYTGQLRSWLQRVLGTWSAEMVAFRMHGASAAQPAMLVCVTKCDEFYKFHQLVAKLQEALSRHSDDSDGSDDGDDSDRSDAGDYSDERSDDSAGDGDGDEGDEGEDTPPDGSDDGDDSDASDSSAEDSDDSADDGDGD